MKKQKNTDHLLSSKARREEIAEKMDPLKGSPELARIYLISFLTSTILIIFGLLLLFININSISTLLGLFIIIIGLIQVIIDIGWMGIVKMNREDSNPSWKEVFYSISKIRGQKIFLLPIIIDTLLISLSFISLFYN